MNNLFEAIKALNLDLKPFSLENLTKKKSYYCAINEINLLFVYIGKTRFLNKDALFLENLAQHFNLKHKHFFTKSQLCSKAKNHLEKKGFRVHVAL